MRPDVTEEQFEDALIKLAVTHGWRVHAERRVTFQRNEDGTARSGGQPIKGHAGYPDVTMVHPTYGIVFAELKSRKGTMRPGQPEWIADLATFDVPGLPVLVELWRPDDWAYIEDCLRHGIDAYRARYRRPVALAATLTTSDDTEEPHG